MPIPFRTRYPLVPLIVLAVLLAVAAFVLGRHTAHPAPAPGAAAGGFAEGLQAGLAQGRQEGRALQEAAAVPSAQRQAVRAAFDDGYAAGADDVFGGYDGGWSRSTPYLVTLASGSGRVTYRISSREPLRPDVDYYLCPDGHRICTRPRTDPSPSPQGRPGASGSRSG